MVRSELLLKKIHDQLTQRSITKQSCGWPSLCHYGVHNVICGGDVKEVQAAGVHVHL